MLMTFVKKETFPKYLICFFHAVKQRTLERLCWMRSKSDSIQPAYHISGPYSIVFVEEVAPLVLDVEQQGEHDDDVDEGDEGHDDKTAVHLV